MIYVTLSPMHPLAYRLSRFARQVADYFPPRERLTLCWALPLALCGAHLWIRFIYWLSDLHTAGAF